MNIGIRAAKAVIGGALLLLLAACASGPQFSQIESGLTAPASDRGRIFVYRTAVFGAAIQPSVKVNGETVGTAAPQGVFYIDRPPGTYKISTTTEVTRSVSLTLEAGEMRYVRLGVSLGFLVGHVYPELVDASVGSSEIKDCHFMGSQAK